MSDSISTNINSVSLSDLISTQAPPSNTTSELNETTTSSSKEESIVILDNDVHDIDSFIDLTKENDDVMILETDSSFARSKRPTRIIKQSIYDKSSSENNLITSSEEELTTIGEPITSFSLATTNNTTDNDIIQEIPNSTTRYIPKKKCVQVVFHICSRSNAANTNRNNLNGTNFTNLELETRTNIDTTNSNRTTSTLDSESRQNCAAGSSTTTTTSSSSSLSSNGISNIALELDRFNNNHQLPDTSSLIAAIRHDTFAQSKRSRIDDTPSSLATTSAKSSQKGRTPKNLKTAHLTTNSNPQSSITSIQCPICLETLDEIKAHNKRLKSTFCGHILCNECLDATFKSNFIGTGSNKSILCPNCRTKLTKSKIHDLFL